MKAFLKSSLDLSTFSPLLCPAQTGRFIHLKRTVLLPDISASGSVSNFFSSSWATFSGVLIYPPCSPLNCVLLIQIFPELCWPKQDERIQVGPSEKWEINAVPCKCSPRAAIQALRLKRDINKVLSAKSSAKQVTVLSQKPPADWRGSLQEWHSQHWHKFHHIFLFPITERNITPKGTCL